MYIQLEYLSHLFTDNVQKSSLTFHWIGVYLAHVPSPIGFTDVPYAQLPYPILRMCNADPMVFRNDVTLNC